MIQRIILSLATLVITITGMNAQCDNKSLHLDGSNQDYVFISPSPIPPSSDFTVELWFRSSSTSNNTSCDNETLITLGNSSNTEYLTLSDCNGDLVLDAFGSGCSASSNIATGIRSSWHHVAISYGGGQLDVILDCNNVYTSSTCSLGTLDEIHIGVFHTLSTTTHFHGEIDDIRIWSSTKSAIDICQMSKCRIDSIPSDLLAYYTCDQGVAGDPSFPTNDNTSITTLKNELGNTLYDGQLNNFILTGQTSNFICSSAPLLYPSEYSISIKDYTRSMEISEVCIGEPAHFCLQDTSGNVAGYDPDVKITWQYNNGSGWKDINLPSFNGVCFGVSQGELVIDCTTNLNGYETWQIRTQQTIYNGTDSCTYNIGLDTLIICCDVDPVQIDIQTLSGNTLLCEGVPEPLNVNLSSTYPFISNPSGDVTIEWSYILSGVNYPLSALQNSTNFGINFGIHFPAGPFCFEAVITHCDSAKVHTFRECIQVDPIPICDSIDAMEVVGTLDIIETDTLVYSLCAGGAAKVLMTGAFSNCIPSWEYAFDPSFTLAFPLGTTNSQINTNIVPTSQWPPGAERIYYRVACAPISNPSGCDTCYSNIVGIEIKSEPDPIRISGPDTICQGDTAIWSVVNPDTSLNYDWICDGINISSDTSINVSQYTCCYLEARDDCNTFTSDQKCLSICEPRALISCPLAPNTCPAVGDTVHLTACSSVSNCGDLSYEFQWDSGSLVDTSGCDIYHVPLASGSVYSVIVTDAYGCKDSTSISIIPCAQ